MSQPQQPPSRADVVAEARRWIGTPYHPGGQVHGAGADCGTFIYCVYKNCGLVTTDDDANEVFAHDWFCNTKDERYMFKLLRHAHKVAEAVAFPTLHAEPGNIVLTKAVNSRLYNHGGIVTKWPRLVHAVHPQVAEITASTDRLWECQTVLVLDPWEKLANDDR